MPDLPPPLICISSNYAWTIYNFRMGLIRALKNAGYRVLVISEADGYEEKIQQECRFIPLKNMVRDGTNPVKDLKLLREYFQIFSREKPLVSLHYTIKPNVYGNIAARLAGIKVISTINGLGTTFAMPGPLKHLVKSLYRTSLRRAEVVVFQNEEDRKLFQDFNLVAESKTRRVPGSGVNVDRFSPVVPPEHEGTIMLMAARLLWTKGVGIYAEAAKKVKAVHPSAQFWLLGAYVESPDAIAPQNMQPWIEGGYINYQGVTDNMPRFFAKADAVVLPSYYREGVPRVLLEALAMGKPIITTDNIGCRETVSHECNGYLIEPKDADALAEAMIKFIDLNKHEKQIMGANSRHKALQEFDEQLVVDTYLEEIRRIDTPEAVLQS
ncbi:MAG: glycosyltransferase family 4 protein [Bacteroidota bacterium]